MISAHLAVLYAVQVRALMQAIKGKLERFPADSSFELTPGDASLRTLWQSVQCQIFVFISLVLSYLVPKPTWWSE
jgi:hypothetical protein